MGNSHSGVVSSVNNSFSWATLARFQEDTINKSSSSTNKFFQRPELKHKRTINLYIKARTNYIIRSKTMFEAKTSNFSGFAKYCFKFFKLTFYNDN